MKLYNKIQGSMVVKINKYGVMCLDIKDKGDDKDGDGDGGN